MTALGGDPYSEAEDRGPSTAGRGHHRLPVERVGATAADSIHLRYEPTCERGCLALLWQETVP